MDPFLIKRNDTLPSLAAILSDENGAYDLTGCTVFFTMRAQCSANGSRGVTKFKSPAVLVDSVAGSVRYEWSPGDTDTAGVFLGEFEVVTSEAKVLTFPTQDYIPVSVMEDVG